MVSVGLTDELDEEGIMVTPEYARAYVDELQRLASRPRPATPSGLRRLLSRKSR